MNPDSPIDPRAALESSLTALLLGELPHDQAAALHQKLAQDAELAKLYERLKQTINLVRETISSPAAQTADQPTPLKLSDQRRQKLLQQFKTVAPKEFVPPRRRAMPWLVPVGIAAAFVLILGALLLPALSKAKSKGQHLAFRTWSLSDQAESAPLAPPIAPSTGRHQDLNQNQRVDRFGVEERLLRAATPPTPPAEPAASPAKSPGTAILLPHAPELADATTTPSAAEGGKDWSTSASQRGFYDDSFARAGGAGAGGTFGGFRGNAALTSGAAEGRQPEPATTDFLLGLRKPTGAASAPNIIADSRDSEHLKQDNPGTFYSYSAAPLSAATLTAPAVVPPPAAAAAPLEDLELAKTPLEAHGTEKTAGDLVLDGIVLRQKLVEAQSSIKAQGGSAPAQQAGTSTGTSASGNPAAGTLTLNYQGDIDQAHLFSNGQAGLANSDADKVPILGDVPALGRYYRIKPGVEVGGADANAAAPAKPQIANRGLIESGVGVAANTPALTLAQPTEPPSTTTRGYTDTSAAWKLDTGNANAPLSARAGQTKNEASTLAAGRLLTEERVKSGELAGGYALQDKKIAAGGEAGRSESHDLNVYSLGAVGYVTRPLADASVTTGQPSQPASGERYKESSQLTELSTEAKGVSRPAKSSIVLPSSPSEASLARKGSNGKDVQLLASANQPGATPATHGDTVKQVTEDAAQAQLHFEAKSPLEESERLSKVAAPAPVPQPEVSTSDNPFSTFSLNVSDVSFKLAGASLEKGVMPEPGTVRSEEFINAFDYRDPEPPPGVPVAFAWERAQYPFAQNRDLLRFSIKTAAQGRQPGRALNLVLLLDNSGSMERADRVSIIREALRVLAGQLQPQDVFSVVTFARTAHLWVDGVPGNEATKVAEEVSGLTPEGGTNLEDAMNLAYQTALRHYLANGVNRVVLLTDGAANLGNVEPEALKQKVEANRKQGIALDCFGIGWEGYNDDLLEVLSRNGDGRYAFLNSPEEVTSEFAAKLAGALQVAASDVKVQVEFNPNRATAYRQIGYAKHQLTKEQFRDNSVNAAQIGAAEAGNALYTVEVKPAGTGPLCTVRVRFRIPGTTDYREHAWDVPFAGNAVALEQASPAMRLAATASAFSEWLVASPYAGEVTPDRLLGYLSGVPEVYGADPRPKKLEWMVRQAKSIAGK